MLPREREVRRSVRYQATKLADSGVYGAWEEVQAALIGKGRTNVVQALSSPFFRWRLTMRCGDARRKRRDWPDR
jgi:hypothetical protein